MAPTEDILARLEQLEKRVAIYDLIATYGPAVDSGSARAAASLWSTEGTYDYGNQTLAGRSAVEAMVNGPEHQDLIAHGAGHVLGFPLVQIDGDRATATCYSQVWLHKDGRFLPWRLSANRWELTWVGSAWKVDSRRTYQLNGDEQARALLGQAVAGSDQP
ncbi:MAG TPA: nuclear transport factor 2 family protein [Acidimicrobiales bacterium]|nr:nuclear transport factor 2 family protein [Acidimicrobiales bacterium]